MSSTPIDSSVQSDLETASAPFLAVGILYGLTGLLALLVGVGLRSFPVHLLGVFAWVFCSGAGLVIVGVGLRRRWRYILPVALVLGVPGLLQVPIGTLLYGWAFYSLWKRRELFYPFDRPTLPKA